MMAPKKIETIKPETVRLSWRTMQVIKLVSWVWQMRPGAQPIMGVVVGTHVEVVAPPAAVVVTHQVVDICEVVWQTKAVEVEPVVDGEAVVEVIVEVFGVVEGAAEPSVVDEGVGESVVEGVSVVVGAAVVAAADSVVVGSSLVVGVSVVFGACVFLGEVVPLLFFCLFRKSSPDAGNAQFPRSISAAVAASISEHPASVRHLSIKSNLFNCDRHREMLSWSLHEI
jgi:hypothetical protein